MPDMSKPLDVAEARIDALKYRAEQHRAKAKTHLDLADEVDRIRDELERDLYGMQRFSEEADA